jgi:c-di-GMP-related signal transduction protein
VLIARQPIVDAERAVVAYELFDRSTPADAHTPASDIALIFNALTHTGSESLVGKLTIFVNCTHNSLAGGHLDLIQPDKVVLEITPVEGHGAQDILARSHTLATCAGAASAWPSTTPSWRRPMPPGSRWPTS